MDIEKRIFSDFPFLPTSIFVYMCSCKLLYSTFVHLNFISLYKHQRCSVWILIRIKLWLRQTNASAFGNILYTKIYWSNVTLIFRKQHISRRNFYKHFKLHNILYNILVHRTWILASSKFDFFSARCCLFYKKQIWRAKHIMNDRVALNFTCVA